ncbi:hypothetical protein KBC70_03580 [Candidatus Woesebacteria bacterium]|nr:hypothetical protein [Candidatus Woesebacteria bacterium]
MDKVMKSKPLGVNWTLIYCTVLLAIWGFFMFKIGEKEPHTGPLIEMSVRSGEVLNISGNASMLAASNDDFILRNFETEDLLGATEKNLHPIGWEGDFHSIVQEEITGHWLVEKGTVVTVRLEGTPQLKVVTGLDTVDLLAARVNTSIGVLLVGFLIALLLGLPK